MSKIRTYESNSQLTSSTQHLFLVVPDVKDTNLWEQFTTLSVTGVPVEWLFLMSKIRTYESNSQLIWECNSVGIGCSWCQRYELMRAIHNHSTSVPPPPEVVPDVKDTNLWEQFTTPGACVRTRKSLFLMSKIRTYESNSQPIIVNKQSILSCSWCQRYELMRAIHNGSSNGSTWTQVVPDVKDTNLWEQFTTPQSNGRERRELFLMSKIRTYESNSQHPLIFRIGVIRCSWCQRYELMRAIHNSASSGLKYW